MECMSPSEFFQWIVKIIKKRILILVCFFFLVAIIFSFIKFTDILLKPLWETLIMDLGSNTLLGSTGAFMLCVALFLILYSFIQFYNDYFKKKFNLLLFVIISISLTVLVVGLVFIHFAIYPQENSWKLNEITNDNKTRPTTIMIKCTNSYGRLISEDLIHCEVNNLKTDYEVLKSSVTIIYKNGTMKVQKLDFIGSKEIDQISFYARLHNKMINKNETMTSVFRPMFYTASEEKERKRMFLTYFWGLLFLVIVTIPTTIIKIYESIKE